MKLILIALTSLSLSACYVPTKPDEDLTISHQFVTKRIPSELIEVPEPVPQPNLGGTQKDISLWIIENEKRTRTLETQLQKIKEYNKE